MPGRPTSPLAIASKIVLDQTINAPLGTALFFAATKTMEMHPEQVRGTIQVIKKAAQGALLFVLGLLVFFWYLL
jgi:hypothetical protein